MTIAVAVVFGTTLTALTPAFADAPALSTEQVTSVLLHDSMERTTSAGWGADPSGTPYEVTPSAQAAVNDGEGSLVPPAPGRTAAVSWKSEVPADVDVTTALKIARNESERGGAYVGAHVRQQGDRSYAVRIRATETGATELSLASFVGYVATPFAQRTVDVDGALATGINLEIQAVGTDPVVLRARVWAQNEEKPDWQLEYRDAEAGRLTQGGGLGWSHYASSGGVVLPVQVGEITATTVARSDEEPGTDQGTQPGADPEDQPGTDPEDQPGTDPGAQPGTDPETEPGTDPEKGTGIGPCSAEDIVCDTLERSVTGGWGSADTGEAWVPSRGAILDVADGVGSITSPSSGRTAILELRDVRAADVSGSFSFGIRELPSSGSGVYVSGAVRVTPDGAYGIRVRVQPNGVAHLSIVRLSDLTTAKTLAEYRWDQRVATDTDLRIAYQVTGTDEVHLAAKMWAANGVEPGAWQVAAEDSSQDRISQPGGSGLTVYSSTGGSVRTVDIDDFRMQKVGDGAPGPGAPDPGAPDPDDQDQVRGEPGAREVADFDDVAPADAIYVSPNGVDSASGSRGAPRRTVTAALRMVPNGGTIVLRAGSYHEEVLVPPQKRVTIQAAPREEVWFDGAAPVSGWRSEGAVWIKDGWDTRLDSSPTYTKGAPDNTTPGWQFVNPAKPMAAHPDQVWIEGTQLTEVARRDQVGAGTFFVDDSRRQLVIGSDPTGADVAASTLTQALSVRSVGSEIRGIGVRRYATSVPQMGTVIVAANDVSLTDVVIRDNSTTGVYSWGLRTSLTRVSLINNGLLGGGAATADGLTLHRVLSRGNNAEGFNRAPVSGAFKVTRSRGVTVTDSAFIENTGQGPWFDESVYDITFTGNDVIGNTGNGLVLELSERAVVADNIVADNDLSGIYVINTGNVAIWNNTVVGNQRNVNITQDSRRASDTKAAGHDPRQPLPDPTVSWIIAKTVVSNNIIGDASGNCLVCVEDRSKEFTAAQMVSSMNGNLYSRPSNSQPAWFGVWSRGAAGNPSVSSTLAEFTAATGQERRSVLIEGASVVTDLRTLRPTYLVRQGEIAVPVPGAVSNVSHLPSGASVLGAQDR